MDTVVIGIHGLRNKPPKYVLTSWWKKSIVEGLQAMKLPVPPFHFEMAFWAHYMHPRPQDARVTDPEHPQFLREPYVPGTVFGPRDPEPFRKRISADIHQQVLQLLTGKNGFMNVEALSNAILRRMFIELDIYYHKRLRDGFGGSRPARELLREELARLLRKHRGKSIMILAHSMGTIIAYDVLLHVTPEIPVDTLITLGAPLGFPVITKKIRQELNRDPESDAPLPTPPAIRRKWLNFSDPDDVTCLNHNLRNHYAENAHGVRPFDQIVFNNYEYQGTRNPHKNYGYLRTPEVAEALYHFLVLESAGWWQRLKWVFRKPVM